MKDLGEILRQEGSALVSGSMVSVTEVRVSPDLGYAKVFVSFFPVKDKKEALAKLREHSANIRYKLGSKIGKQMRVVPDLNFILDDSIDRANRIDELLNS